MPEDRKRDSANWDLDAPVAAGRSGAPFPEETSQKTAASESATPHPFGRSESSRYEPVAELGVGGMGRVLSAIDHRLQRHVALKQVGSELRDRPGIEQRFAREAWITAALDHPAIVPIFDAGRAPDGGLYYTMRLIRGRTLSSAIREANGLPGRLALLRHVMVACEAVAYAHSQGVVHRDLKPDNILVGEFGETQVVDWGLACKLHEARTAPSGDPSMGAAVTATAFGAILGTPAYMSPEQAAGDAADPRSDVFSLGRILYELISGQPLFDECDAEAVLRAVRHGEIPPLAAQALDAPKELIAIVEKALAVVPAQRYADARALATDIDHFLDGRRVSAHRYSLFQEVLRRARPFRLPLLIALVATVLLISLAIWAWLRTRVERDLAVAAQQQTRTALAEADLHLSRALIEQSLSAQAAGAQAEAEVLAAHALSLAESPDARGVLAAFALAARPRLLEKIELPRCLRLRPRHDGALLCIRSDSVSMWSGRPLRAAWQHNVSAEDAMWLNDGKRVVVSTANIRAMILDAESGALVRRIDPPLRAPRGWIDAVHAEVAVLHNLYGLSIVQERGGVLRDVVSCDGTRSHLASALTERGDRLVVACQDGSFAVLDGNGVSIHRITTDLFNERYGISALAISPSGNTIIAMLLDGEAVVVDVGSGAVRLRRRLEIGNARSLHFAPDGQRVLILSDRGGATVWQPHTGSVLRRLPAGRDQEAMWSPTGAELLTIGAQLRRWSLPDSLPPLQLLEPRGPGLASAAISPNGKRAALAKGDGVLEVLDTASGKLLFRDRFQEGVLKGVSFVRGGAELLAWGIGDPSLRRYDEHGTVLKTEALAALRRAVLLPSGWLIGLGFAPYAGLYDLRQNAAQVRQIGSREFFDAAQSHDEKVVFMLDSEGALWEVRDQSPQPRERLLLHRPGAVAVASSKGGAEVAVATANDIELIDTTSQRTRVRCTSSGLRILDLALSADGRWLAAGDADRNTRIWSARDGRLVAVLRGHFSRVSGVAFSRDGDTLLTASWDGSARLFELTMLERPARELQDEAKSAWGLDLEGIQSSRSY